MKFMRTLGVILLATVACAVDIATLKHVVYKDATITRAVVLIRTNVIFTFKTAF